jgi:mannose/fructose/N-acetylgalactosamine-specific phosphotransferase system component IIC
MNAILISLAGAVILLDKYAIGEFGISQPIVSGAVLGAIFGDMRTGILLGAVFQLVFLGGLPIGRDVPPDAQGAGIAGCGSYFLLRTSAAHETAFVCAAVLGILAGVLGSVIDISIRQYNERLYYRFLRDDRKLELCHLAGILTSFLRNLMLLLPVFVFASFFTAPPLLRLKTESFLLAVVAVGMANALSLFVRKNTSYLFILGLACGLALLVL